jgi:ATP-dependent DNA helicase pcrA
LFYVAITRAQKKLFLTSCKKRRHLKDFVECAPSRFVDEIPAELVTFHEPKIETTEEQKAKIYAALREKFGNDKS